MTCGKTQEFLAKAGVSALQVVDAKKKTLGEADALAMLAGIDHVYVAKGKKVVHVKLKGADLKEVAAMMLGPTGNLRAPTLRVGRTLLVGFEEGMYREVLG